MSMARRPNNPGGDRAAQNQQTLKNLVKLEGNKSCADCKRNKHPRWASWNLGVFICIRCSGIHRGMGTHISRVKSVDLDAWTDEQMKSILQWGNVRANKYWEAKLAPGHVPSEAKIENFIRTKYESKRWVMDGPMPDPATLDADGDEDVPLGVVQGKQHMERASSNPPSSTGQLAQQPKPAQSIDLFGDNDVPAPRPRTTEPPTKAPPAPGPEPSKPPKPADTLLGLDFLGPSASATGGRAATNVPASRGPASSSRPDLKQSILSLYASAPRQAQPAPVSQPDPAAATARQPAAVGQASQQPFGGLSDAFGGLSFSSTPQSPPVQQHTSSPFAQLGGLSSQKATPAAPQLSSSGLSDGGFFASSTKPTQTNTRSAPITSSMPPAVPPKAPAVTSAMPTQTIPASTKASSDLNSLFDMSAPSAPPPPPKPLTSPSTTTQHSVFNLSAPPPTSQAASNSTSKVPDQKPSLDAGWGSTDAWASNDAWTSGDSTSTATSKPLSPPATTATANDFGWGGSSLASVGGAPAASASNQAPAIPPAVSADEDFGGWSSAVPPTPTTSSRPAGVAAPGKPGGGFSGSDDLFSNVWE